MRPGSWIFSRSARAQRALRAVALVATLVLGAAVHELHHALDPGCGTDAHSTEHACGCSTMHAAALLADAQDAPAPASLERVVVAPPVPSAPAAAPHALAAPRGPPAA